jgi:hypothetical protein
VVAVYRVPSPKGRPLARLLISAAKGVVHAEDDAERMRAEVQQLVTIFLAGVRAAPAGEARRA